MYLVAGSAAEQLVLRKQDFGGSREDRRLFGAPDGFTFDDEVKQAEAVLLNHKPRIEKLAYRLDGMYRKAGGDFSGFRSQLARTGQEIHDHWVLLDEEELKAELSLALGFN